MSGRDQKSLAAQAHTPASDVPNARARLWFAILILGAITTLWMRVAGLAVDLPSALPPALACAGLELLATFYLTRRPEPRFAVTLSGLAQIIAVSAFAGLLSYAAAATGGPLWDGTFQALDKALGLDWPAYLHTLNDHPRLGFALSLAYQSLMPQMILVVIVLGFSGRLSAVRDFVLAFMIAGLITVLLSGLMPAMAMFVHLGLRPQDFPGLNPAAAYVHLAPLSGLRDGTVRIISLAEIEGIITFPSFHAALGVLFARFFWMSRITRWPGLAVNAMLIAATPIDGGHYFVDVGAGALIAVAAIAAARILNRSATRRSGMSDAPVALTATSA
ncbi:phosphatase PAP2 family protein [Methylobacterium sp. Leaf117]|uniref:phosphatase PAP2 family protein n=1 Tax=Methylobacterium sp. Leaf117 TaxID=1736260 RepID=UPI0009EB13D6|nr:phosphatase PAP2 family protein [Methylobacterium sp. Leaf117]